MAGQENYENYTDEEKQLMATADAEQQDRKRILYEKQVNEQSEKNDKKQKA